MTEWPRRTATESPLVASQHRAVPSFPHETTRSPAGARWTGGKVVKVALQHRALCPHPVHVHVHSGEIDEGRQVMLRVGSSAPPPALPSRCFVQGLTVRSSLAETRRVP
jgi:hypothetical protein